MNQNTAFVQTIFIALVILALIAYASLHTASAENVWSFKEAPDTEVMFARNAINKENSILHVVHDDGSWAFLNNGPTTIGSFDVISLQEATKIDPSILMLADLGDGWFATRDSISSPWIRGESEGDTVLPRQIEERIDKARSLSK